MSVEVIFLSRGDWRDSLDDHFVETLDIEHLRAKILKSAQFKESGNFHLLVFSFNFLPRSDSFFLSQAGIEILMVVFGE